MSVQELDAKIANLRSKLNSKASSPDKAKVDLSALEGRINRLSQKRATLLEGGLVQSVKALNAGSGKAKKNGKGKVKAQGQGKAKKQGAGKGKANKNGQGKAKKQGAGKAKKNGQGKAKKQGAGKAKRRVVADVPTFVAPGVEEPQVVAAPAQAQA